MERCKTNILEIHEAKLLVFMNGKPVRLSATDLKVLSALVAGKGDVYTRDELAALLKKSGAECGLRRVDDIIHRIRKKLGNEEVIRTVYGVGYAATHGPPAL